MANICENTLAYTCHKDDVDYINDYMKEKFSVSLCEETDCYEDTVRYEIDFDSRWDFPALLLNEMLKGLKHPKLFDGTCLSVEWGNLYCAFHTSCEGREWNYA